MLFRRREGGTINFCNKKKRKLDHGSIFEKRFVFLVILKFVQIAVWSLFVRDGSNLRVALGGGGGGRGGRQLETMQYSCFPCLCTFCLYMTYRLEA